jgi:hypothetical protein
MIPAAAFTPKTHGVRYSKGSVIMTQSDTIGASYEAPVNLPHGVTVTKLVLYFIDPDLTYRATASLFCNPVPGDSQFFMATVSSPEALLVGSWTYLEDTTIDNPIIDNQANMYRVSMEVPPSSTGPSGTIAVKGVRIDYSYPLMLPAVTR